MNRLIKHLILTVAGATILGAMTLERAVAATLSGQILRPPAEVNARKPVSRYRGRDAAPASATGDDCQCNPGLYSVVYLTGDNLPTLTQPDTIPTIAQKEQRFEPSVLAVAVGTSVGFPNLDPYYHNVFSYSKAKRFDLGRYPRGESKVVEFDKPGLVNVFCEIHFSMRAYVHVLETPYFTVSDEQGRFNIDNIVPGDYTLHVWQENLPDIERPISVANDSTYLEIE